MKTRYVLSFVSGAAIMLGFSAVRGSSPSHHVYELRMYHVHEGKMDALKARFGDHTDAIFKRHNMNSVGYWVPEDAPSSRTLCSPFSKVKPNPESETLSKQSLENKRT